VPTWTAYRGWLAAAGDVEDVDVPGRAAIGMYIFR
jgi:hypothetical protein